MRDKPILVADIMINHLVQVMQTFVRLAVIIIAIFYTPMVLLYYAGVVSIISLLFGYHMIWYNPKDIGYRIVYSLVNEVYFSWTHLHALFTINRQGSWDTR